MKKLLYLTLLFICISFTKIKGILIKTVVMKNNEGQEIVLYGDLHFYKDQQKVDFQNNHLKSKLEEFFKKDSQTEIFYEGPSTTNNNATKLDNDDKLQKETLFVIEEICKLNPKQCFNIDPRSYIPSIMRIFTYLASPNIDDQDIYNTFNDESNNDESKLIKEEIYSDYDERSKFLNNWKTYIINNRQYLMQPISSILDEINKLYSSLKNNIEQIQDEKIKNLLLAKLQEANVENSTISKLANSFGLEKTILEIRKEPYTTLHEIFVEIILETVRKELSSKDLVEILLEKRRKELSKITDNDKYILEIFLQEKKKELSRIPSKDLLEISLQKERKELSSQSNENLLERLFQLSNNETYIFLDIHSVLQILQSKSLKIILFAGLTHTENLKNILQKLGYFVQYESEIKDQNDNIYSYKGFLNSLKEWNCKFQPINITDLNYIY